MNGAIMVYGGTQTDRIEKVNTILENLGLKQGSNHPDLMEINLVEGKNSIGINEARELIKFFTQKPFSSKHKAATILNAEKLTIQAQNALLKILEEIPNYASIILETPTESSLLETILSRCKRLPVKSVSVSNAQTSFKEVSAMSRGERLSWAIEFSKNDKIVILNTLESWIIELRTAKKFSNIKLINKILKDLKDTNLNTRLAIEYLVLEMKS